MAVCQQRHADPELYSRPSRLLMPLTWADAMIPPMPPSEYAVAAERSLQGLFLEMLERDDADDGDGHQLDPRGEMAESALRIRYDQEVAKLLAPTGRWTLSQHDDVSDTFAPHQTVPTSWPCKRQALKAAALP